MLFGLFAPAVSRAADGLPVVHLSILPGATASQSSRLFAESLPRNSSFIVELPASTITQSGLLRVWPAKEEEPDCVASGGKQSYCFPMSLETVQGRPVLRTTVPQLQSGLAFQFAVEQYETLPPDAALSLARGVAALILAPQEASPQPEPPPCDLTRPFGISKSTFDAYLNLPKVAGTAGRAATATGLAEALQSADADDPNSRESLEKALTAALASEMTRRKISGEAKFVAGLALDDFFLTNERRNFLQRDEDLQAKLATLKDTQARLCSTFTRAFKTLDARLPAPTVDIDGKVVVVTNFFDKRHAALLNDAALTSAITQLTTWISLSAPNSTGADAWRTALQSVLDADPAERPRVAAAIDRSAFQNQFVPAFWDPERRKMLSAPQALTEFERISPEVLRTQLEALRGEFVEAQQPAVTRMITSFRTLNEDRDKRNKARADVEAARAARDQAFQQIRGALAQSLQAPSVVSALRTLRASQGRSDPKLLRTPSAGSFASPDLGVFLAAPVLFPRGSSSPGLAGGEPWVLPYVGLNLYLEPVEREVPLDQLVESKHRLFSRQRWSGTLGFVFKTEPNIRGRRVQAPILGAYPVIGVGYRVTSYLRVTGGAVGYWLLDSNPVSQRQSPVAAPFIGASIDTDLVSLLLNAVNPKGR